jgi:nicotinamidase-related amidase
MNAALCEPERRRDNVALLLIDFQRDFCDFGGYVDQFADVAFAREILPQAQRLLSLARSLELCVVHTREGYAPDLSDCSWQRQIRSARAGAPIGADGPLGRFLIRGEPGHALVRELEPIAGEVVVDKPSYGAFYNTGLEAELRERGVQHLYFSGVTADVCVHTTLREATDRGFFCHYVIDAISTFDPELRSACARMVEVEGGIWGRLADTDEVLEEFSRLPSRIP